MKFDVKIILVFISVMFVFNSAHAFSTVGEGWDGVGLGYADLTWYLASETTDMSFDE